MKHPVDVFLEDGKAVSQPSTFRCCPLGLQFFSTESIDTGKEMELRLEPTKEAPDQPSIHATGIVVHCQPDNVHDMYRIWMMFMDLPEDVCQQLECLADDENILCPHCMNFRSKPAA